LGSCGVTGPWEFDEAHAKLQRCSAEQKAAEAFVKAAYKDFAEARGNFREALAKKIVELRDQGTSVTLCEKLAAGDKHVVTLEKKKDIAEGVVEAAKQRSWTAAADRKDAQGLAEWSMRRELAEMH
jgi:hypothetical protein